MKFKLNDRNTDILFAGLEFIIDTLDVLKNIKNNEELVKKLPENSPLNVYNEEQFEQTKETLIHIQEILTRQKNSESYQQSKEFSEETFELYVKDLPIEGVKYIKVNLDKVEDIPHDVLDKYLNNIKRILDKYDLQYIIVPSGGRLPELVIENL